MVLPSFEDLIVVVIFLIPGFLTLSIVKRLGIIFLDLSEFELTLWSIGFTLIAIIPFALITGLTDFDMIKQEILHPQNIAILFGSTIGVGVAVGLAFKLIRKNYVFGDPWEVIMKRYNNNPNWITVITKTGQEYMGKFRAAGVATDRRELIMSKPVQIFRDANGNYIQEMEVGEEIIFTEDDISRVSFTYAWDDQLKK